MPTKKNLWLAGSLLLFALVVGYLFSPILFNLSTQLYDWNDYPLIVWIIDQHLDHVLAGNWGQFFQSNIFYPFQDTLLFSDLLLPSALIALPIYLVIPNIITAFNITFFITLLLNFIASWHLWRKTWDGPLLSLAAFVTALMPFVIVNTSHYQMITLWPFLFGFSHLLNNKWGKWQPFWLGFWTSVTFVSSVYLSIFLMYCIGIWALVQLLAEREDFAKNWKTWLRWGSIFVLTVAVLAGPFMYKYYAVRQFYDAKRDFGEYVNYSASIFDYVSNSSYQSVLSNTALFQRWNRLLATAAGGFFPTFILSALAVWNFVIFKKKKPLQFGIGLPMNRSTLFFLALAISGLIFSLGPRLRVGSVYIGPPLPYAVLLKFIPIFEPIRATSRWSLLFFIGVIFFALLGLKKVLKKIDVKWHAPVIGLVLLVYFAEALPVNRTFEPATPERAISTHLKPLCDDASVLLEYPILYNPYGDGRGIFMMLQHWTGIVIDATDHNCNVVNGYSGYSPDAYNEYHISVDESLNTTNTEAFQELLEKRNVELLRIHTEKLTATQSGTLSEWREKTNAEEVFESEDEIIYAVGEESK